MPTADGASDLQPGAEVILTGLKGNAALNGEQGIVQPRDEWPSHENRIAVMVWKRWSNAATREKQLRRGETRGGINARLN